MSFEFAGNTDIGRSNLGDRRYRGERRDCNLAGRIAVDGLTPDELS